MRGKNINNVYIVNGKELNSKELTKNQLLIVEIDENRTLYNNFRNKILSQNGDDIQCTIKIRIPDMIFEAYDDFGVKIL
jgi:hypothetical protein